MKNITKRFALFTFAALAMTAFLPSTGMAEDHPRYLHALADLRHARAHLEGRHGDPATNWDSHVAIKEVDAAIGEIKRAAIDDGKSLEDHPPIDARIDFRGRLHQAADLLRKAHEDIRQEEDNGFANGLKHRALEHIDAALNLTEQGITNIERR